jgi:hypothetical protein
MLKILITILFAMVFIFPTFLLNYLNDVEIGLVYGVWIILVIHFSSILGINNPYFIGNSLRDWEKLVYISPIIAFFTVPLLFIKIFPSWLNIFILILASFVCGINIWFIISGLIGILVFRLGYPADPFIAPCTAFFTDSSTQKVSEINLEIVLSSIIALFLICNFSCMCAYIVGSLLKQNRGEFFVIVNTSLPIVSAVYLYLYGNVKILPLGYVVDPLSFLLGYLAGLCLGLLISKYFKFKVEFPVEIVLLLYNSIFGIHNLILYLLCRTLAKLRKGNPISHFGYFIIPTFLFYFNYLYGNLQI